MTNNKSQITNHILFICTGNLCRSPIAAALWNKLICGQSQITNHQSQASSAGLKGIDGHPAHPLAVELMQARGLELAQHRSRTVTPDMLMNADLILTMENDHLQWILTKMPILQDRTHLLGRWQGREIPDPMQGGREAFEEMVNQIEQCLIGWSIHLKREAVSSPVATAATVES